MTRPWVPTSWRSHQARQQPDYEDEGALAAATAGLRARPPLVAAADSAALRRELAEAQAGRAFLLQAGDCAESFAQFSPEAVGAAVSLLDSLAARIEQSGGPRVIRVGRIAGQFAKPRSRQLEMRGSRVLPTFRGDIVNGMAFDEVERRPDPQRLLRAHDQAAATLALLRGQSGEKPIYTSHEALLLPFEEALVRRHATGWYGSSAHFLWIGDRTRFAGSAHIELLRGLTNPLGVKCGPTLTADSLPLLLDTLNPERIAGRVTLIARMGAGRIETTLPPLLRAAARAGHPVLWTCDPMHGNTVKTAASYKTRRLDSIVAELRSFFGLLRAEGLQPGGIHIEATGGDVTECLGAGTGEADLQRRYESYCDPRLNPEQAWEVAAAIAEELAAGRSAAAA